MLKKLIKLQLLLQVREIQSWTSVQKISTLLLVIVMALFAVPFAGMMGLTLADLENLGSLFSVAMLFLAVIVLVMTIPTVFSTLYRAPDLPLLFALPIPTKKLFLSKVIAHLLQTPLLLFIASTVLIAVAGAGAQASPLFYLVLIPVLAFVILGSLAGVYLITLVLAQFIPGYRTKELTTVLTAVTGIGFFIGIQLLLASPESQAPAELLLRDFPVWLPTTWAGAVLADGFNGSFTLTTFWYAFSLALTVIVLLLLSMFLIEKGFRMGWVQSNDQGSKQKRSKQTKEKRLSSPTRALMKKEQAYFLRDSREWLQLSQLFLFLFILSFPIIRSESFDLIQAQPLLSWSLFQIVFFIAFIVGSGPFVAASVGREGSNLELLQSLPLKGIDLAKAKWLFHSVALLILLAVFELTAMVFFGWSLAHTLLGFATITVALTGITSLCLWIGTLYPRFNADQPQARIQATGSIILIVASFIYCLILLLPLGFFLAPLEEIQREAEMMYHPFVDLVAFLSRVKSTSPVTTTLISAFVLLCALGMSFYFLLQSGKRFDAGVEIDYVEKKQASS